MRARTNIALKNRYTATLTDFKGVDLNTSPLRVATNRASSMKNFICDNGILHKRPGWEEQFRIFRSVEKTDADGNTVTEDVAQEIHAIFPFSEDGNEVLLIHAGKGIYRAAKNSDGKWEYECKSDGIADINENRASCFYRGGKAYIAGCGNFLCYGKHDGESYTLVDVVNSDLPYVPVTSYGIGGSEEQYNPDAVNLLTRKRINTLTGSNKREESKDGEGNPIPGPFVESFKLDANIATGTAVSVEGSCYFTQTDENGTQSSFKIEFSETITYGDKHEGHYIYISADMAKGGLTATHCNGNISTANKDGIECYYITISYIPSYSATLLNFHFPTGSIDGKPNITVTFTAEGGEEYTQRLKKCRFGTTFGVNGANDRLFLAGNPDHPNMDFWSEANDFTYFPDGNTMEVGSAHAAINGYARLSDTTLAVLKEEKAGEPTIFYRTGAEKHDTANLKYDAYFPVAAGIAGDGIVNHHAGATLAGDVMVVTRSGVHALVLSSNVASGERYTRERSRPIYKELASSDELADAAGIVYRNRYYLALPKAGKCYVADAHYKAAFDGSADYNYEWWVWDNVHASCFAEYEDKLLFGTPDGLICAFVEGTFADRTYTDFGEGDLLCEECGRVIYNKEKIFSVGDRVVLKGDVYARLGKVTEINSMQAIPDSETKEIVFSTDNIDAYYEGQTVLCAENDSAFEGECTVHEIDVAERTVTLRRDGENFYDKMPENKKIDSFYLLEGVDGEELYVSAVDEGNGRFTVARGRVFLDNGAYTVLAKVSGISENGVLTAEDASRLFKGRTVCVGNLKKDAKGIALGALYTFSKEELQPDTLYTVDEVNQIENTFTLKNADGESYKPENAEFYVLCPYGELFLCQRNNEIETNGSQMNWTGLCAHAAPVCAEWVTPVMDFGTNASTKTLLGVTVATEPGLGTQTGVSGVMTFGYETRRQAIGLELPVGSVGMGVDFSGLDFNNFSFGESFACSYTRRMNVRNFNFIVFRFGSDIEQDCAVSSVTLQYKINRKNHGLR